MSLRKGPPLVEGALTQDCGESHCKDHGHPSSGLQSEMSSAEVMGAAGTQNKRIFNIVGADLDPPRREGSFPAQGKLPSLKGFKVKLDDH